MIIINTVSDITNHLNMVITELESSNIKNTEKIEKDLVQALEWGYVEHKAINIRLIQFYTEVICGIKELSYSNRIQSFSQCKDCFVRIKENQIEHLTSIDFYQNTTIKIREAKFNQLVIKKVDEILKSM